MLCFCQYSLSITDMRPDRVRVIMLKKIKALHYIWSKGFKWFISTLLSNEVKQPFSIKTWMGNIGSCIQYSSFVIFSVKLSLGTLGLKTALQVQITRVFCNYSLLKVSSFYLKQRNALYYTSRFEANLRKE